MEQEVGKRGFLCGARKGRGRPGRHPHRAVALAQLHDLLQLKHENSYLTTITKQIAPYVRSIAKVKERLEPRLQEAKEKDSQAENLLNIYDDSMTGTGDVLHRTDLSNEAAEGRERPSESRAESHALNLPAEDPLLKSKDCCKSQPKGRGGSPPMGGGGSRSGGETAPASDTHSIH